MTFVPSRLDRDGFCGFADGGVTQCKQPPGQQEATCNHHLQLGGEGGSDHAVELLKKIPVRLPTVRGSSGVTVKSRQRQAVVPTGCNG